MPGLLTVRLRPLVLLVLPLLAASTGCRENHINIPVGGDATDYRVTGTIGSQGGRLSVDDPANPAYGAELTVPAGAVDSDTEISLSPVDSPPAAPFGTRMIGTVIDLRIPALDRPATLRLRFQIDPSVNEELAVFHTGAAAGFDPFELGTDDGDRRVALPVEAAGQFYVLAVPRQTVADGGAPDQGPGTDAGGPGGPSSDRTPPTFAGLAGVTTDGPRRVSLAWEAGRDDETPVERLRYRIYVPSFATVGTRVAETEAGATGVSLPVTPGITLYFLVRAVDEAGNEDSNLVVRALAVPGLTGDAGPDADAPVDVPVDVPADVPGDVPADLPPDALADGPADVGPDVFLYTCPGGPATSALPATCADIRAANSQAADGEYTLYVDRVLELPWTAYCHDMAGSPREYLTLPNTVGVNFAQYTAGGASPGTDVRTSYTRIRLRPQDFTVDISDQTFSTSTGTLMHGGEQVVSMPYGVAFGCDGTINGVASIDLRGTAFRVVERFCGTAPTFSSDGQVVDIIGGGFCGWTAPNPCPFNPFNQTGGAILNLQHVQLPSTAALWLRADSVTGVANRDPVPYWPDVSGAGADAAQADPALTPVLNQSCLAGQPVVTFDGNDVLTVASAQLFSSASSGSTTFVIFRAFDIASLQRFLLTRLESNCVNNYELGYRTGDNDRPNFGLHAGCSVATVTTSNLAREQFVLYTTRVLPQGTPPANVDIFLDGAQQSVEADQGGWPAAGSYPAGPGALHVGGRPFNGSGDSYHLGDIAEVLIYDRDLSDTERQFVESYLRARYGF